jgi:hypothetical protein
MDPIERMLIRWIEEDRLERRRERARKRNPSEADKRVQDWFRRAKKEILSGENQKRAEKSA